MLTRLASFRASSSISQKQNKRIQSKSLRQNIGFVIEDEKKEKRRILMDSVLHKIPFRRRNSKDPKKLSPQHVTPRLVLEDFDEPTSKLKTADKQLLCGLLVNELPG
ncbi:hypothetical protein Tco_0403989 [Tanacetum coccineum]